jgi:hypothetical protein
LTSFLNIMLGVGIGLITSLIAWLLTMLFLSPRVRIDGQDLGRDIGLASTYQVLIANHSRWRSLVDAKVACDLHIPHHRNEENILTLRSSEESFPIVPPHWKRVITVQMDPSSLTPFGRDRLNDRLAELHPPRKSGDISSLFEVFSLIPAARIEVTVFSYDRISGARKVSNASLTVKPTG